MQLIAGLRHRVTVCFLLLVSLHPDVLMGTGNTKSYGILKQKVQPPHPWGGGGGGLVL